MSNRSWFYAVEGQQNGPFPEAQLRDLIVRGTVGPDTLVWTEGMRWVCRNIQGTRREAIFTGTGLEFLWRSIVTALGCFFIIPIPWMYRWLMRWLASQTVLAERATLDR